MLAHGWSSLLCLIAALACQSSAHQLSYRADIVPRQVSIFDDRPEECPPCFNCNLEQFRCQQFANCTQATGQCTCPTGFGGMDCSSPLCGSPVDEKNRIPRGSSTEPCQCDEGWEGINCQVCNSNAACNALMPENTGGVCYRQGLVVKENYQMCDVVNQKIIEILDPRKPQVTFSCNAAEAACNFQFWVDQLEAFYCELHNCTFDLEAESNRNTTTYQCENINCKCIPDRVLCGAADSINIDDFLENAIKGPASFETISTEGGSAEDGSYFKEKAMNGLIQNVFGDDSIRLSCNAGECLYQTEVPGFAKPIKTINTPLIAGIISGVGIFIVAVVLLIWRLTRRSSAERYGPLHMQEDDDESSKLIADHRPTAFHFENVSYNLKGRSILSGVQGAVHPGEILAIMGGSGAGKTTFIDILARKRKKGQAGGDFYINGEIISNTDFRNVIGFVDQDDTMLPTLTVHETILDSAMLRLPKDMGLAAKEQRVNDVEKQLGISHIRDQLIGSEEGSGRGISGGEKRRVGIACELVTSPSILFLDEPTSGLDAYNAFNVVECLVNLVKTYNRTVIFTIHQPRSNIIALFDRLILLAKGRTVYSGPFSELQSYFDGIGYSCPPGFNIADYVVDLTMHASLGNSAMDAFIEAGRDSKAQTRNSSIMAIKSLASTANLNGGGLARSPTTDVFRRPTGSRKISLKQQQDSLLYGRPSMDRPSYERQSTDRPSLDRSNSADSPVSNDDVLLDDPRAASQAWLHLSEQSTARNQEDGNQFGDVQATGTDLDYLVSNYAQSSVAKQLRDETKQLVSEANASNGMPNGGLANGRDDNRNRVKGHRKVGFIGQFQILSVRVWRNLYRNPMLLLTHYAISIILAVLLGFLYYGLADDLAGFQNRLGLLFFILALFGFSTLTSLTVFAAERLLFTRERAKGYYYPISYFAAKVIFDVVPLRLIPPIILGIIVYPMTGLVAAWPQFFNFMLFLVLFNFAAAAMCLFIGVIFRNPGVANLIGSLTMLFSLLFAGFLLNHDKIPKFVVWLQNISIFHYAFEGLIVNEVKQLSLTDHKYGLDIEVPGAAIVSSFGFNVNGLKSDALGLGIFTGVFIIIAYLAMHILLVERR